MEVFAATVFVLMYAIIVSEKIHRTVAAMLGAIIMMLAGVLACLPAGRTRWCPRSWRGSTNWPVWTLRL